MANVSGAKQSEFLTVPSSFSSLHQQREMRRSSSEQAPCTLHTELPEMRSKSFDYGSLPSCRQGEIYTSASAKKERRRGYLVRQVAHIAFYLKTQSNEQNVFGVFKMFFFLKKIRLKIVSLSIYLCKSL